MANHLKHLGFQPHLVRDGTQAAKRLLSQHFEAVFVTTGLDGSGGLRLCRTIKRTAEARQRPPPTVVMLLDRDEAVHHLCAGQAGTEVCLPKPCKPTH